MRRLVWLPCIVTALVICTSANNAQAGGLEYAGAGAQGLGRAGAVAARADDPMVLSYNPAGLAELRGGQLMINANFTAMSACVDPIGYYGWGAYEGGGPSRLRDPATGKTLNLNLGSAGEPAASYYTSQLDTVCMKNKLWAVPQLAFTARVSERLGIGFGLMFPNATPQGSWGSENGVIEGAGGLRPAATRYQLLRSGTIGIFPTVGFGYRIADWLRIGASFEWGMIAVDNTTMAVVAAGSSPSNDVIAHAQGTDYFIPAVNGSIHLVPSDALDIVAAIRIQDNIAAAGTVDVTTGEFDQRAVPETTTTKVTAIKQKMPWQLRAAIRYSDRLAPRPTGTGMGEANGLGRIHDAMEDERWDLELDVQYEMNGRNQRQVIDYEEMQSINFRKPDGSVTSASFPDPPRTGASTDSIIEKHWKDQISVRAGGTYNVLPGLFAISLGAHYETRGVDPDYMQIDFWPVSRFGLHAGVKFRVAKTIDLVASYAHIIQETIVVGAPEAEDRTAIYTRYGETGVVTTIDKHVGIAPGRGQQPPLLAETGPSTVDGRAKVAQVVTKVTAGNPPYLVNSGTYRSSIDAFAIGANVHF